MLIHTLEKLRKLAVLTFDGYNGSRVQKHYQDIENILTTNDSPESKQKREEYLKNILQHAVKSTPYYKKHQDYSSIEDFPVINKLVIRQNFTDFESLNFKSLKRFPVVTSGSTGTPFRIYQDANKKDRNSADALYYGALAGFELGQRLYYLKVWNQINRKILPVRWLQNVVPQDVSDLSDKTIKEFIQVLRKDKSSINIISYASALDVICKYMDENNLGKVESDFRSIIAMSESINDTTKSKIIKYFGIPAVSRYSNVENGIIAQQCYDNNKEYHINNASYFVEILDFEKDTPVEKGMLGRIVVTDLFNYAMPMIRYDTGDVGSMKDEPACRFKTPVFTHIEGRRMDLIYNTWGDVVSSFIITNTMWEFAELNQYQFIQEGEKNYRFKLNIESKFIREEELIKKFKTYLGQDAVIIIEYVSEIPLLASGKRKKVVNEMNLSQK